MLKEFYVSFDGLTLGGEAVIIAPTKVKAIKILKQHDYFKRDPNVKYEMNDGTEVDLNKMFKDGVMLHFWDGDY